MDKFYRLACSGGENVGSGGVVAAGCIVGGVTTMGRKRSAFLSSLSIRRLVPRSSSYSTQLDINGLVTLRKSVGGSIKDTRLPRGVLGCQRSGCI